MRVLLVDDEQELVETLAERLEMRGISADWATRAEAALELAERYVYDVAVLDIKIPGMSGIELKKYLEQARPGMQYIFMTGHGSEESFAEGISETGEDYYLIKPIDINVLIRKMYEIKEGRA